MLSFPQLVRGLQQFMDQAGKSRAVLGLSGGVDSALTARIAAEALGADNVTALILPNEGVNDALDVADAESFAESLSIPHFTVPINAFLKAYGDLPWPGSKLAGMNLSARVRATILYHYANSLDALVLGTGNRTELLLGYFTKYGDGACDVEVIGRLYKTEVWAMARETGVPETIVTKAPSAGLFVGQTDEEELGMTYADIDSALRMIERGKKPTGSAADKVRALMKAARHKAEMPPAL